jgi:APA family basic amino acid/polyamine antiporter
VIAVAVIVMLSALNYVGVRVGSQVQTALTGAKLLAIAVIVIVGLLFALTTDSRPATAVASGPVGGAPLSEFLLAMVAGLFAYGGWHMVTYTAGETVMPARTIPVALITGVAIVTACYVALNLLYLAVLPLDAVRESTRIAADAADVVVGRGGSAVLAGLVMMSSLGGLHGNRSDRTARMRDVERWPCVRMARPRASDHRTPSRRSWRRQSGPAPWRPQESTASSSRA